MKAEDFLGWAIPSPEDCRTTVAKLREANPKASDEQLVEKAKRQAKKWGAVTGAATGVWSTPATMLPAAGIEVGNVLRLEGKLIGVIGAILDPDSLNDYDTFRTDVITVLFPAVATQALQQAGVRAGQQTTKTLIRKYISKGVLKALIQFAAKYLGVKLTQKMLITKVLPIVGAAIGAGWNWREIGAVGARAVRYYLDQPIESDDPADATDPADTSTDPGDTDPTDPG